MPLPHGKLALRRLCAVLLAVMVIWGYVLPRLQQTPFMRARIEHLRRHGIDSAAMFYTDHPKRHVWDHSSR